MTWFARRLLYAVALGAGIAVLSFVVLYANPGDAVDVIADQRGVTDTAGRDALLRQLGLDRPLPARLATWLGGVARADLGDSWSRPGASVGDVLRQHLPLTLALTGTGLLLQIVLGVGLAAFAVQRRGSVGESMLNAAAVALGALPEFCLALLLLWPFAVTLGWFPLSGVWTEPWNPPASFGARAVDALHHLVLPAFCLGVGGAATVARLLRVRWEEELAARSVTSALARGLTRRRVVWVHALRRAAGPLCTAIGLSLPALIGGAVVIERVFAWPGLGSVLVDAVADRDLPLLAGVNLVFALLVATGGLLSDVLWGLLDPRARKT